MKFALYSEYIGADRKASSRRMVAAAATEEAMQEIIDNLPPGWNQLRWRVEDFETGETILRF